MENDEIKEEIVIEEKIEETEKVEKKKMNPKLKSVIEWTYCIIIAVTLALLVRYYIGTPTIVQQPSMYPTLIEDQRLLLNRLTKTTGGEFKRGDIVTFESPSENYIIQSNFDKDNTLAKYENDPKGFFKGFVHNVLEIGKKSYIKRIVATAGEHLEIKNGLVYINGEELKEEYLKENITTTSLNGVFTDLVVPEGSVFVMGDNRPRSSDSRSFGCIPINRLEGKVVIRIWPFDVFGKID